MQNKGVSIMKKGKYPRWQPDTSPKPGRKTKQEEIAEAKSKKEPITDYRKEFLRKFRPLTYCRGPYDVWSDFVTMTACTISNVLDKGNFSVREAAYLRIAEKYQKQELQVFPELLALMTLSLEKNPEQDFLGSMFMELNLGNRHSGQVFTPYHVGQLMADMVLTNVVSDVKEKGYITIHDSCCGSGTLLISSANTIKAKLAKEGMNYQNHLLVTAQDIDMTVALMCYIQLSLLGIAGYIKVRDSLTDPITAEDTSENYWFTPMYFSDIWHTRRMIDAFKELLGGAQ